MIFEKPTACYNCCSLGGGLYKPFVGETRWHMGLDENGQAHFACEGCAPGLIDARPIEIAPVKQTARERVVASYPEAVAETYGSNGWRIVHYGPYGASKELGQSLRSSRAAWENAARRLGWVKP